ncbi:MAG: hypothetical protein LKE46_00150 [Clostridium sp.]|jgi:hypothetical protein|uniref:hypothetical protein n=1 Tax=Clostridium sp. TaxID=1506 RepID=UPI0025C655C5|nr:hypothetical protein [Clostridium sp.]MCH3962678.1 hypothetical protein [Clostridium sp.]MCI2201063.1 hypothetical protein [Clostridium sp.]
MDYLTAFVESRFFLEWIKPIVTPLMVTLITYSVGVLRKRRKSESVIRSVKVANKQLVDAVRPFFIQKIKLRKEVILNIRNAIKERYDNIELDSLFTLDQIKENIILDISETRFLKDQDKFDLIDFTEDTFKEYVPEENEQIAENQNIDMLIRERDKIARYDEMLIFTMVPIIVTVLMFLIQNVFMISKNHKPVNIFFSTENIFIAAGIAVLIIGSVNAIMKIVEHLKNKKE